jgi:hypothetical protein
MHGTFSANGAGMRLQRSSFIFLAWFGGMVFAVGFMGKGFADDALQRTERVRFFEAKIRPVLVERCEGCHSVEAERSGKLKAGLYLDSRKGIMEGGDSGPAVVPNKPGESLLLKAMRHESREIAMPPKEPMLAKGILEDFARWITDGAEDPRENGSSSVAKRRGLPLEEGRAFWSMQAPKRPPLPVVKNKAWIRNAVDQFVLESMEREGVRPAEDASAQVLLRRLHLDLTGLPPSPSEVEAFRREDAAAVVDRLLESPHFGERWGRHWLDVARYADSNGKDRNVIFHHAWRYRDYVFDSFAADKPFDVFLREQIAGDLMAVSEPSKRDELLVASGFLALGSKAYEETRPEVFRMDVIDEQIEVLGRGVLGLSVACARCHDHKFEAIPTADYYALAGILRSSQPLYGYGPRGIKSTAFHHTELHALGEDGRALGVAGLDYLKRLDDLTLRMHVARADRYRVQRRVPDAKRIVEKAVGEERVEAECVVAGLEAEIADWHVRVAALEAEVTALQDSAPPMPAWAMGMRDRATMEDCRIHVRGEATLLGESVPRGFLKVVQVSGAATPGAGGSGRLELAAWLTDRSNPLTARVYVNRVWSHLFGRGLVTTPDDFGVTGSAPSHPELLDYLAVEFMEGGWSTKRLIRSLVLSRVYGLDSRAAEGMRERDPDNRWFGRMRPRLMDAEVLHDSVLSAAGELDLHRPTEPFFARFHPYRDSEWFPFKPFVTRSEMVTTHRAVYLPVVRGVLPDALELFDFASPDRPVAGRTESVVPTQALYLMNNPRVAKLAEGAAMRSAEGGRSGEKRVVWLFRAVLGRDPNAAELDRVMVFVQGDQSTTASAGDEERWADVAHMLFGSVEHRLVR